MFPADAHLLVVLEHIRSIVRNYVNTLDHIEEMLRQQLVQAIGKEISSQDFADYMRFNDKKIFKREYLPRPFSYTVRLPDHYPEGVVSILDKKVAEPALTHVRYVKRAFKF